MLLSDLPYCFLIDMPQTIPTISKSISLLTVLGVHTLLFIPGQLHFFFLCPPILLSENPDNGVWYEQVITISCKIVCNVLVLKSFKLSFCFVINPVHWCFLMLQKCFEVFLSLNYSSDFLKLKNTKNSIPSSKKTGFILFHNFNSINWSKQPLFIL